MIPDGFVRVAIPSCYPFRSWLGLEISWAGFFKKKEISWAADVRNVTVPVEAAARLGQESEALEEHDDCSVCQPKRLGTKKKISVKHLSSQAFKRKKSQEQP